MKKGDVMPGRYPCGACQKPHGPLVYHSGWTYCGEQKLSGSREATLANCPECHSTRVVEEVRDGDD